MAFQISNRLKTISSYVFPYKHLIDVGTDHCLVPIYLVINNIISDAIATDINVGPVIEAKKNVQLYHLDEKINVRLGDGLASITDSDKADVVIIAGMGGRLIQGILSEGIQLLTQNKRLILQANLEQGQVRSWLCENHYEIVEEKILKEENIFYEIIVADKTNKKIVYTNEEIKFGPKLLIQKDAIFLEKWQAKLIHNEEIIQNIPNNHENKIRIKTEIKEIKQFILNN